LEKVLGYVQV